MYARMVRFTDVSRERIDEIKERIDAAEGPPEGVDSTGFKVFYDESQETAIFCGLFETEEKMRAAHETLDAMDPSDTPGNRASVDQCEIVVEAEA